MFETSDSQNSHCWDPRHLQSLQSHLQGQEGLRKQVLLQLHHLQTRKCQDLKTDLEPVGSSFCCWVALQNYFWPSDPQISKDAAATVEVCTGASALPQTTKLTPRKSSKGDGSLRNHLRSEISESSAKVTKICLTNFIGTQTTFPCILLSQVHQMPQRMQKLVLVLSWIVKQRSGKTWDCNICFQQKFVSLTESCFPRHFGCQVIHNVSTSKPMNS